MREHNYFRVLRHSFLANALSQLLHENVISSEHFKTHFQQMFCPNCCMKTHPSQMLRNNHSMKMPLPHGRRGGGPIKKFFNPKNPWSQHRITISPIGESGIPLEGPPASSKIESDL